VSQALARVREVARRDKKVKFTALLHHVTVDSLREAYRALNHKASPGIDEVTWVDYGEDLEANIQGLHSKVHCGSYKPQPSRRAYIPKPDGRKRPLGVAALEDKIVQAAVVKVLNAIYEEDFMGFSYGFRPKRGAHDALAALDVGIFRTRVSWVLDADIQGFFDSIDHHWLEEFVKHRIADTRILRLIHKWLNAGVMEKGQWTNSEEGTPQGATVSPLLANIFLHYVLDLWVHHWRRTQAKGDVIIVRYADDFVVGFQHRDEAEKFWAQLRERFRKFGLELHPQKTRLIEFGRYASERRMRQGLGKPETFSFLGFRHISGRSRAGRFLIHRHTDAKRLRAKLKEVGAELQRRQHLPVDVQGEWLRGVVRGYYNYHAIPTNIHALETFHTEIGRAWHAVLRRRSHADRTNWIRMKTLVTLWLPRPRILHPWPDQRFDATTRGKSRMQ
jgi:group II intron reverse transcriptase/maturase